MGKVQEIYEQILTLENELNSFSEKKATDADREKFYPKKLKLSNLCCDFASLIEAHYPKESLYYYWKAYCLNEHPIAFNHIFGRKIYGPDESPLIIHRTLEKKSLLEKIEESEADLIKEMHLSLENISLEEHKFLEALQHIFGAGKTQNIQQGLSILGSETNNPYVHLYLGYIEHYGYLRVPINCQSAQQHYEAALKLENGLAHYRLGLMNEERRGNFDQSISHYKLAAEQGLAIAQVMLADKYLMGWMALEKNVELAMHYYFLAAQQKNARAQFQLGKMHQLGLYGVTRSCRTAFHYYMLAAEQGNEDAKEALINLANEGNQSVQLQLGKIHELGLGGFPKNDNQAALYYYLAAEQGNEDAKEALIRMVKQGNNPARWRLGKLYEFGSCGFPKNDILAVFYYYLAAVQGNGGAQQKLLDMGRQKKMPWEFYLKIKEDFRPGVIAENFSHAIVYYRSAAGLGLADAQFEIGKVFETGLGGIPKDETQAVLYYSLAAEQGHIEARNKLIRMVEQGNVSAQFEMGKIYESSLGNFAKGETQAVDYETYAVHYYKLATEKGHVGARNALIRMANQGKVFAQFEMGKVFETGLGGIPKDETQAAHYYKMATDQGYSEARNALASMADQGNALALFYMGNMCELRDDRGYGNREDQEKAFSHYQLAAGFKKPVSLRDSQQFYQYLTSGDNPERIVQFIDQAGSAIEKNQKVCSMIDFHRFLWTDDKRDVRSEFKEIVKKHPCFLDKASIPYVITHCDEMMACPAMKVKRSTAITRVFSFGPVCIRDRLTREMLIDLLKNVKQVATIQELEADTNLMALLEDSDKVAIMLVNEHYETIPANIESRLLPAIREAASNGLKGGKKLLSAIYNRGNIPVQTSNIPLFLKDKQVFENDDNNPVISYFKSIQQQVFDEKNPETIYCVIRMTESEMHLSHFQKHMSFEVLLDFIKKDESLPFEERKNYCSRLLPLIFSQEKLLFTPSIVDIMIDRYKETPGFLIDYLRRGGSDARRLFLRRAQERGTSYDEIMKDTFGNTTDPIILEALSELKGESSVKQLRSLFIVPLGRNPAAFHSPSQEQDENTRRGTNKLSAPPDNMPTPFDALGDNSL